MTIFYPDISSFQGNISLAGTVAVCAKATEGTGWNDSTYATHQAEAARHNVFFFGYHFLHAGNGAAQADHCFAKVGKTPIMLDWEQTTGSMPGVADAVAFIDRFRALGGIVNLVYLPKWYWLKIGSPSLAPIANRGLANVQSAYTSYSDTSINWNAFGGLTVAVWQFSSSFPFSGQRVDFNAYRGTLDQFKALVIGKDVVPMKPEDQVLSFGASGDAVTYLQKRLNVWGAKVAEDGQFGNGTLTAVKAFQTAHKLTSDGVVGPKTWLELDKNPSGSKTWQAWTAGGMYSLADFAKNVAGTDVASLVSNTVKHYGHLDAAATAYVDGLAAGTVKPTDKIKGATFWVFA